ncbi:DNA cytosine methyltransferase [Trabulsiella odontotermitis]|uniref:DNA cytosine methyltransferase n=1 Tax=Trabulsiella odontotermitis TaxID=379893 RepID=UPI00092CEA42|nr:DNA cytosine methyltransferase [Trabulsiella odontotermitis]
MNVIDLFAGVGGLSLGAARAGFNVAAAIEIDEFAIASHHVNFPKSRHFTDDVASIKGQALLTSLGLDTLDCLVGGPPCQGFSAIGKGDVMDKRNQLYFHFFRLISEMKPVCFLAENVPGIMSEKYDAIRNSAFSLIKDDYWLLDPIKVKASDYGAATTRTRIFFIGFRKDLSEGSLQEINFLPKAGIKKTTVKDALLGIDFNVHSSWQSEEDGWRLIKRNYEGNFFEKLWGEVPEGVGDLLALEKLQRNYVSGFLGTRHSPEVELRYKKLSYGETDKVSRSMRLDPDGFCPTLRAGTAKDKGSYQAVRPIHPFMPRVISPREAARLQGFPDWFQFHSTKWHSFRQIGNSVSPIVAEAMLLPLAELCKKHIQNCTFENQGIAL